MRYFAIFLSLFLVHSHSLSTAKTPNSTQLEKKLTKKFKKLDDRFAGEFGVALQSLDGAKQIKYKADRRWYLSSTTKVPIAIAVLKEVEAKNLSLQEQMELLQSDYVDGSGRVNYEKPGAKYSIQDLISRMIRESDSTATDMLVRRIGIEKVNKTISQITPGFGPITSILDVRYKAYGYLHPDAKKLSNMDFIDLKKVNASERLKMFAKKINVKPSQLKQKSLENAFEEYYKTGENSSDLPAFTNLLSKLENGEILSKENTDFLLSEMSFVQTGKNRIQAGLGSSFKFKQKTGTQVDRICNVGIIEAQNSKVKWALASCVSDFPSHAKAEEILKEIGSILKNTPDLF